MDGFRDFLVATESVSDASPRKHKTCQRTSVDLWLIGFNSIVETLNLILAIVLRPYYTGLLTNMTRAIFATLTRHYSLSNTLAVGYIIQLVRRQFGSKRRKNVHRRESRIPYLQASQPLTAASCLGPLPLLIFRPSRSARLLTRDCYRNPIQLSV